MLELTRRNNGLNYYNPFGEIEELERYFFGNSVWNLPSENRLGEFRTDITDEGDHFLLEADLPGFEKNDIHIELEKDVLVINASRRSRLEEKDEKDKIVRIERSYGSYSRRFNVSAIDTEGIKAKYENGVLKLTLPKKQEKVQEKRQLDIE